MSRTIGAYDRQQRKTRSDKGKRHKTFRGKPTKGKKKVRFVKQIGNKEFIKIWIWQRLPMSYDGYLRWNKYNRPHAKKEVTKFLNVHLVHVSEINSKSKIIDFLCLNYWSGTFLVMGFSNAKNKYHCKPVKLCKVIIKETQNGNIGRMTNNYRLHRYWFWNK